MLGGGQPITEQARLKISKKLKGIKRSEETRKRMSNGNHTVWTETTRKKIIEDHKDRKWFYNPLTNQSKCFKSCETIPDDWVKGRPKSHFVNTHTVESNKKRSDALIGCVVSKEKREKLRISLLGHNVSQETKEKISNSMRLYYEKTCNGTDNQRDQENRKCR